MLTSRCNDKGFSLLGLIVATGMVLIVMVGVVGLTVRVMRASTDAKNNFIATALAREGIELVRSLRDDNYLNYDPARTGSEARTIIYWRGLDQSDPDPSNQENGGVVLRELRRAAICNNYGNNWIIDPINDSSGDAPTLQDPGDTRLFFNSTSHMYVHDDVGNKETPFSRVIRVDTPGGGNCGMFTDASDDQSSPFTVTSTVTWETEDGTSREVSLTQELHAILRFR
jgi:type II secretory pathway pseudopilin PulG